MKRNKFSFIGMCVALVILAILMFLSFGGGEVIAFSNAGKSVENFMYSFLEKGVRDDRKDAFNQLVSSESSEHTTGEKETSKTTENVLDTDESADKEVKKSSGDESDSAEQKDVGENGEDTSKGSKEWTSKETESSVSSYKSEGYIVIDDEKCKVPLKIKDLEEKGYYLDYAGTGVSEEFLVLPYETINVDLVVVTGEEKNELAGARVSVVNMSDTEKSLKDCEIFSFCITNDSHFKVRGDISCGNSRSDIEKVFGEPLVKSGDVRKYADKYDGFVIVEYSGKKATTVTYSLGDEEAVNAREKLNSLDEE